MFFAIIWLKLQLDACIFFQLFLFDDNMPRGVHIYNQSERSLLNLLGGCPIGQYI
jgi:hypothetical protein